MCLSYCFVGVWCWQSREWTNKCLFLPIIGVGSVSVYGGDLHDHGARWLMLQHSTCIMIGSIHAAPHRLPTPLITILRIRIRGRFKCTKNTKLQRAASFLRGFFVEHCTHDAKKSPFNLISRTVISDGCIIQS